MTFIQRIRRSSAMAIMTTILALAAVGSIVFLTACGGKPQEAPQPAPAAQAVPAPAPTALQAPAAPPVVVQAAPPAHDNTLSNMLMGGMLGYMIGNSGSQRAQAPTVVNRTTIIRQAPAPSVRPSPPTAIRPTYRPSYRSSYTSSFRSGRR